MFFHSNASPYIPPPLSPVPGLAPTTVRWWRSMSGGRRGLTLQPLESTRYTLGIWHRLCPSFLPLCDIGICKNTNTYARKNNSRWHRLIPVSIRSSLTIEHAIRLSPKEVGDGHHPTIPSHPIPSQCHPSRKLISYISSL